MEEELKFEELLFFTTRTIDKVLISKSFTSRIPLTIEMIEIIENVCRGVNEIKRKFKTYYNPDVLNIKLSLSILNVWLKVNLDNQDYYSNFINDESPLFSYLRSPGNYKPDPLVEDGTRVADSHQPAPANPPTGGVQIRTGVVGPRTPVTPPPRTGQTQAGQAQTQAGQAQTQAGQTQTQAGQAQAGQTPKQNRNNPQNPAAAGTGHKGKRRR